MILWFKSVLILIYKLIIFYIKLPLSELELSINKLKLGFNSNNYILYISVLLGLRLYDKLINVMVVSEVYIFNWIILNIVYYAKFTLNKLLSLLLIIINILLIIVGVFALLYVIEYIFEMLLDERLSLLSSKIDDLYSLIKEVDTPQPTNTIPTNPISTIIPTPTVEVMSIPTSSTVDILIGCGLIILGLGLLYWGYTVYNNNGISNIGDNVGDNISSNIGKASDTVSSNLGTVESVGQSGALMHTHSAYLEQVSIVNELTAIIEAQRALDNGVVTGVDSTITMLDSLTNNLDNVSTSISHALITTRPRLFLNCDIFNMAYSVPNSAVINNMPFHFTSVISANPNNALFANIVEVASNVSV